jgi:hypothetical protein
MLQALSDNGVPNSEFDLSDGISADTDDSMMFRNEEDMDMHAFVDEASSEVSLISPIKPLGSVAAAASLKPKAVELSKIQYLEAAIAEKKQQVLSQKLAILKEKEGIQRETKLMKKNMKILALNEEQINQSQDLLKAMLKDYAGSIGTKKFHATKKAATKAHVSAASLPHKKADEMKHDIKKSVAKEIAKEVNKSAAKAITAKADAKKAKKAEASKADATPASLLDSMSETDEAIEALEAMV